MLQRVLSGMTRVLTRVRTDWPPGQVTEQALGPVLVRRIGLCFSVHSSWELAAAEIMKT